MTNTKSDPTKDPQFQKVVQHFLKTPPKPHKKGGEKKGGSRRPSSVKKSS